MSNIGVSSTARKREGWNFKCALIFRYNQAPPAIAYIHQYLLQPPKQPTDLVCLFLMVEVF